VNGIELFVWYRCPAEQAARVATAAERVLARVAHDCGVHGRLLQRLDAECTWMEHYALADGADRLPQLLHCMQDVWPADLPARHLERFQASAPTAATAA